MLRVLLFIGAGSFAGGVARYLLSHTVQTGVTSGFPWGTMVVNVLGCFVIGMLNALFERGHVMNTDLRMFLTTGFCGGFTTFSTFMNEGSALMKDEHYTYMMLYLFGSLALGLIAVLSGHQLAKWV